MITASVDGAPVTSGTESEPMRETLPNLERVLGVKVQTLPAPKKSFL